jgi:hypothetical protein
MILKIKNLEEIVMRRRLELCFLFLSVVLFLAIPVHGSDVKGDPGKLPHKIPAVSSKVKIDGDLSEKAWEEALVLGLNYEVEPGENIKPPVKTMVYLAYGSDRLYVAFRCFDPDPSAIRAHVTDRDNIDNDDHVGLVLDTFNDSRRTYNFFCNPYGIQADYISSLTGGGDEWDSIWNSAGRINDDGYTVEMAIPLSALRFQRKKGEDVQVWGIDIVRSYPRTLSHVIGLFPRDRDSNCYMCQADKVIGFSGAKPSKNLEFVPTLSAVLTQEREGFPDGPFEEKTSKLHPGLTARWGFTPNLTLSATVNPDFSQVEADAAQLDVNLQFALFYPEKRPFFFEGSSIFKSIFYVLHTRSIADPNWGIKLSGKEGKNAIGIFAVQDNITNLFFPWSQGTDITSLDMNNFSSVLRYRRDVGKSSNVGFIITDREGENYFNRVAGIDGDLRVTKTDRIMFQFLGSQTQYPDEIAAQFNQPMDNFDGRALDLNYHHRSEHLFLFCHYQEATPQFRADLGFMTQVDFKYLNVGGGYTWRRNPGHWYTTLHWGLRYTSETDHSGNMLGRHFRSWFRYFGPLQSFIYVHANIGGKKSYQGVEFDDNFVHFQLEMRPAGSLFLRLLGDIGDMIDFSNVRSGDRIRLNPIIQYNLGRHIYLGLDHVFEKLNVESGRLYTANLTNFRLIYQFNRRAFLRTTLQYANYDYNADNYTYPIDSKYRHLFTQFLFSYKINPQTVLFLGYSDDHYGDQNIPLTQNNRTLFIKIGYALAL